MPRTGTCDFRGGSGTRPERICDGGDTAFFVVTLIHYPEVTTVGESERTLGFDLDDQHSPGGCPDFSNRTGCCVPDFVSPDGAFQGIDNQAPAATSSISWLGIDPNDAARDTIADNQFTALIELRNWDGSRDDPCINVVVHEGTALDPLIFDSNGRIQPEQRFAIQHSPREYFAGSMQDGELRADRGGFPIPEPFMVDLHNAHLRLQLLGDALSGLVAGEMPIEPAVASLSCRSERFSADLFQRVAEGMADLRPDADGICQSLSWTIEIEAVAAIVETSE